MVNRGLSLDYVLNFLEEVKQSNVKLGELLQTYKTLKSLGLSITQLSKALLYKSRLEGLGLTIEGLKEVYRSSEACEGFNGLIKAINTYGTLQAMEVELKKLSEEKTYIKEVLKLYEELKSLGFDKYVLKELKNISSKYEGVREVIGAVSTYGSLTELKSEVEEIMKKKSSLETELKRVEADYAYLQSVIKICETLFYKLKFSVTAITEK